MNLSGSPKLTAEQAADINASDEPTRALAGRYGVNVTTIRRIRRGVMWWRSLGPDAGKPTPPRYASPRERFEASYIAVPETGCWLWEGACTESGYGRLKIGHNPVSAHRFAYQAYIGPIPPGLFACHKCDTPPCVNPNHLFLGTAADNVADMVRKGRHRTGMRKAA